MVVSFFLFYFSIHTIVAAGETPAPHAVDRLIGNGGVLLQKGEEALFARHPDTLFVPASILKIATSLEALELLGPPYRFTTEFFLTEEKDLVIKGYGDPFLLSEEVDAIAKNLVERGITSIRNIGLDASAYDLNGKAPGTGTSKNPYEAANSALAVNFNTVYVQLDKDGTVRSAEEQTPLLPIMKRLTAGLTPGKHRVDIGSTPREINQLAGELFAALLSKHSVIINGNIISMESPKGMMPFYVHQSRLDLREMIRALLKHSNNFIANQIFLACGAKVYGYPATWEKGRKAAVEFLKAKGGIHPESFHIVEGSGISRQNRITPRAMMQLLHHFLPHASLLPKDRNRLVKTGTLTGVYSLAGYIRGEGSEFSPFVIMLNQKDNHRDGVLDSLEKVLLKEHP